MAELKSCPKCGGETEIRYACEAIVGVSETGGYQPYCTDCLIAPPYAFFTKQDAADWWNDRKEENENE